MAENWGKIRDNATRLWVSRDGPRRVCCGASMTQQPSSPSASWLDRLLAGDRAALARAITAVENDTGDAAAVLKAAHGHTGRALVVGITGAPGAGKSTLVSAYVRELRSRGLGVGVLAVDPSSPFTGGALLGDRVRMLDHAGDPEVFVRSVASRGHLGGLSRNTARLVDVMDAAGKDVVLVETVGVGQSEIEIASLADVRVVVWAPGAGDEVQAAKAGILEIADILVVNKADLPQAVQTEAALKGAASYLPEARRPRVLTTVAVRGDGVAALADEITARGGRLARDGAEGARRRMAHLLIAAVGDLARTRAGAIDPSELAALSDRVLAGDRPFDAAAADLLRRLAGEAL
jgi:LAO/AO transport system kinase